MSAFLSRDQVNGLSSLGRFDDAPQHAAAAGPVIGLDGAPIANKDDIARVKVHISRRFVPVSRVGFEMHVGGDSNV